MNDRDPFEERLRHQPLRPVPPAWRDEILRAARASAGPVTAPVGPRSSWYSAIEARLSALLWPNPRAWAGLAAAWLVVLGLNFAAHEPARSQAASQAVPPSPQMRELLRQQEQLLAELIGPMDDTIADHPKPAAPQPHSQLREQFVNA